MKVAFKHPNQKARTLGERTLKGHVHLYRKTEDPNQKVSPCNGRGVLIQRSVKDNTTIVTCTSSGIALSTY